jgi:hypothetical protein
MSQDLDGRWLALLAAGAAVGVGVARSHARRGSPVRVSTLSTPIFVDLFAGLCGASEPFVEAGWEVVRVELDLSLLARARCPAGPHVHHVVADARTWSWSRWSDTIPRLRGRRPTVIWASPPCTEFSREDMPWCRTGVTPSLELALAADRIIRDAKPRFWVIENVKGATKHLDPLFGRWKAHLGPVFLWGEFPTLPKLVIPPWKEHLSSTRKAERAKIPRAISDALLAVVTAALLEDL